MFSMLREFIVCTERVYGFFKCINADVDMLNTYRINGILIHVSCIFSLECSISLQIHDSCSNVAAVYTSDVKCACVWYKRCTVCPKSPLGVLKNCGAQTN
jgi:hypothetical protein